MRTTLLTLLLMGVAHIPSTFAAESAKAADAPKVAILYHEKFLRHDTGAHHPENPARLIHVVDFLKNAKTLASKIYWPTFQPASREMLNLVHTPEYLDLVEHTVKSLKKGELKNLSTGDTVVSEHSLEAASLAVGAVASGVDEVMAKRATSAFALVRPPGHHATSARGMGFCIYNQVAIAARYLQQKHGLKRILIVDVDVHHGNGTQDIFYADDSVFYFSVHQHPLYPGSGRPSETGVDKGKGYTLNVDMPIGAGDVAVLSAMQNQLKPAMEKFKPEFILVSAGFDAHEGDQLGDLNYTDQGYAEMAKVLQKMANQYASGRIVYALEGGYSAENISNAVVAILNVLWE